MSHCDGDVTRHYRLQVYKRQAVEIGRARADAFDQLSDHEKQQLYKRGARSADSACCADVGKRDDERAPAVTHISALLQLYRLLKRPRRPPHAFALFVQDRLRGTTYYDDWIDRSPFKATVHEWRHLDVDAKRVGEASHSSHSSTRPIAAVLPRC